MSRPLQLARYLNRTYWEKKQEETRKSPTPSAPAPVPLAEPPPPIAQPVETHPVPVPVQPVNIVEVGGGDTVLSGHRSFSAVRGNVVPQSGYIT